MKLTPSMLRQLKVLHAGSGDVNLLVVGALIKRGLARERYGDELAQSVRMPSAYPLTDAGRAAIEEGGA